MKSLLKFITCGSVDDGKSTLIGHMLYDAKLIFADQKKALELDSKVGSREGKIDYSLLLDGLMAEREQGITIDVAYRYFTTDKRSFIVADTPGHEEYTRNMAVGASFADVAVILIDATQGMLIQTRRHIRICSLMGIKHFVFAINKMDLVHYDKSVYDKIARDIKKFISEFDVHSIRMIPVSATEGDNITHTSSAMPWYHDETLLEYLEKIEPSDLSGQEEFVMAVQRVSRPSHTFRGFQGQINTGEISVGDEVVVLPSGEHAKVAGIYVADQEEETAQAGEPVTLQLDREIDISRGCVLCRNNRAEENSGGEDTPLSIETANMVTVKLFWMDDDRLVPGRNYWIKVGTKMLPASVMNIKYKIDVNSGEQLPAEQIYKNELAVCDIMLSEKCAVSAFDRNKELGSFIFINRVTNMTSACGTIMHTLRRSNNLVWQETDITKQIRSEQKSQTPKTVWFTGLSGSGKSTLANALEKRLVAMGRHTMLLDGDNIRMGLNKNLGFTEADRVENIRRIAEVAKLMNDAGLIVLTAFISPYKRDRENAKEIIGDDFLEVYVSTPIEECERRDVKGLYKKARKGEIPNFTGISSPYEAPDTPDVVVNTQEMSIEDAVSMIVDKM
ncbi:MAG: adenylyl-sulfate kinase [Lachnospiraceae bacterium]|nr:adenylyl-sulfate kinase [Lachnospiraceae bacterium]